MLGKHTKRRRKARKTEMRMRMRSQYIAAVWQWDPADRSYRRRSPVHRLGRNIKSARIAARRMLPVPFNRAPRSHRARRSSCAVRWRSRVDSMTEQIGAAIVTWSPQATDAVRSKIRGAMATIGSSSVPRRRAAPSYPRNRHAAERRGLRALESPDVEPCETARQKIVRIYYRSQGGELLYVETAPMSDRTASSLIGAYGEDSPTDALAVQCFSPSNPQKELYGSRRAILPSQRSEPTTTEKDPPEQSCFPTAPLCVDDPSPGAEPSTVCVEDPPQQAATDATRDIGRLFQAALARRAERAKRWRPTCI